MLRLLLLAAFCGALLVGCYGGAKPAVDVSAQKSEGAVAVPQDSLRAKFLLSLKDAEGKMQELDAVLFSVPGKRYRMELTGPMGIGVASLLWTEEGWTMTFPTEKLYVKGNGYMVGLLMDNSIPMVHIHQVAGLFNGILLPEKYDVIEGGVEVPDSLLHDGGEGAPLQVTYAREKMGKNFAFGKRGEEVAWLCRIGRDGKLETLRFLNFKEFEEKILPGEIIFERDGATFLKIKMKKVTHNKSFSLGTWRLNVPRSFTQIGL